MPSILPLPGTEAFGPNGLLAGPCPVEAHLDPPFSPAWSSTKKAECVGGGLGRRGWGKGGGGGGLELVEKLIQYQTIVDLPV